MEIDDLYRHIGAYKSAFQFFAFDDSMDFEN